MIGKGQENFPNTYHKLRKRAGPISVEKLSQNRWLSIFKATSEFFENLGHGELLCKLDANFAEVLLAFGTLEV